MTPLLSNPLLRAQSDDRLAELAAAGYERAFEAIVERYREPLARYLRRLLSEQLAEDVLQATFVRAWQAIGAGTRVQDLRPWLYRIAHNEAVNELRASGPAESELPESLAATAAAPDIAAERGETVRSALRRIDALPDRQRAALMAVAVDDRPHHLSLKVNQARRDQDRDGMRNRDEFLAGTNPRRADSDEDGTRDDGEGAGTVTSFGNGVLVVHLFNGDDVKGTVDEETEIECESRPMGPVVVGARKADDGPGRSGDDDQGDDDGHHHGDRDEQGDDDDEDECDASALTAGAVVHEAELKTTADGLVFREIEIVVSSSGGS